MWLERNPRQVILVKFRMGRMYDAKSTWINAFRTVLSWTDPVFYLGCFFREGKFSLKRSNCKFREGKVNLRRDRALTLNKTLDGSIWSPCLKHVHPRYSTHSNLCSEWLTLLLKIHIIINIASSQIAPKAILFYRKDLW